MGTISILFEFNYLFKLSISRHNETRCRRCNSICGCGICFNNHRHSKYEKFSHDYVYFQIFLFQTSIHSLVAVKQFMVFGIPSLVVVVLKHQPVSQVETIQMLKHHLIYLMEMPIRNILVLVVVYRTVIHQLHAQLIRVFI